MNEKYICTTIGICKNIALIAHDGKKAEMVEWVGKNKDILSQHTLCATGTTGTLIHEKTDLPVQIFRSGPLGGDQQIGSRIVEGEIDLVIFFWDPLESQPHDPDVKALLRIAAVYDIPIANNLATADFILTSKYMNEDYVHYVTDYNQTVQSRVTQFMK